MMYKPWLIWIGAVLVCASGLFGWWQQAQGLWVPPAPKAPDIGAVQKIDGWPAQPLLGAQDRPPFWPTRKPRPVVQPNVGGGYDELANAALMTVMHTRGHFIALLRRQDGTVLKLGSDSTPWRIDSFDGRVAAFSSAEGQTLSKPLELKRAR